MANIVIKMKDGTQRNFPHVGRPGGCYTKTVRYQGGFVIIEDEDGNEIAFPANDVKEVISTPTKF